jgi:putative FmdB family regulatory protein
MPRYDYKCQTCNHVHEHICRMSAVTQTNLCPRCGHQSNKLISIPLPPVFKGGNPTSNFGKTYPPTKR